MLVTVSINILVWMTELFFDDFYCVF